MTVVLFLTVVFSLAVSAFCSGAETGFLSVSRGRILHMAREGGVRARIIQEAILNMGRTTTAILVGNNLANVSYSSAFTALVVAAETASPAAEAALAFLSALILLFFGEFLPKLLCSARPLHRLLALDKAVLTTEDAADCARWGCATAALCITKRGAIPAMPSLDDVTALLAQ